MCRIRKFTEPKLHFIAVKWNMFSHRKERNENLIRKQGPCHILKSEGHSPKETRLCVWPISGSLFCTLWVIYSQATFDLGQMKTPALKTDSLKCHCVLETITDSVSNINKVKVRGYDQFLIPLPSGCQINYVLWDHLTTGTISKELKNCFPLNRGSFECKI